MATVKFGDVVKEVKVNIDRSTDDHEFFIAGEHMDSNEIHIRRRGRFADSDVGPAFIRLFKPGQVLYGSRRTYLKKVAVADFEGITSNTTFVLETKDQSVFMQELLPYLMLTDRFTDFAVRNSKGSTNPYILFKDIAAYEFELPEYTVQQELVTLLTAMDATSEAYKKLLNRTDALVQSQFVEMFGDPNDATDAAEFTEAFEIRDDLRKPLNDAVRSEMYDGELYPYYGANGKVDEINAFLMDCTAICLAEDCGSYGAGEQSSYIVSGKCWVNNHAHVLIPRKCCNLIYANELFRILDITQFIAGTTRSKLTQAQMKKIPILLPPIEQQEQFAAFVEQTDKSKYLNQFAWVNGREAGDLCA